MNLPRLIGITGYAGHGKDTLRAALASGYGYEGMAFADPIRVMLHSLLQYCDLPPDWMTSRTLKEQPITGLGVSYRQMAQELGTEWGRNLEPDFWLTVAEQRIAALRTDGMVRLCISDVRFSNEADWVRRQGGQVWRVERPGVPPVRRHPSESEIEHIRADVVIDNSGTPEDLPRRIDAAFRSLA